MQQEQQLILATATKEDLHLFDLWRANERLIDSQLIALIKEKTELYQQYNEIWKAICTRHNLPENADLTICRATGAITFTDDNEGGVSG